MITTGGLGPTSDDLTKQSIADLFGRGMHLDDEHLAWMEERWRKRFNRPLPATNRQQAMVPDGATKLQNNHGSAPGIWLEDDRGRWVAMLPGAFRAAKCAACSATRCFRVLRRAYRPAPSFARGRYERPASPNRCSPIRSSRWAAVRLGRRSLIYRGSPASISD